MNRLAWIVGIVVTLVIATLVARELGWVDNNGIR